MVLRALVWALALLVGAAWTGAVDEAEVLLDEAATAQVVRDANGDEVPIYLRTQVADANRFAAKVTFRCSAPGDVSLCFLEWLRYHGVQGIDEADVRAHTDDTKAGAGGVRHGRRGRGWFVTKAQEPGDVLVRIPDRVILYNRSPYLMPGTRKVVDKFWKLVFQIDTHVGGLSLAERGDFRVCEMVVLLMMEFYWKDRSWFGPYLDFLPLDRAAETFMPLVRADQRALFASAQIDAHAMRSFERIHHAFASLVHWKLLPVLEVDKTTNKERPMFGSRNKEEFFVLCALVQGYSFQLHRERYARDGVTINMVPFLDLLNHDAATNSHRFTFELPTDASTTNTATNTAATNTAATTTASEDIVIVASRHVLAGEEATHTYSGFADVPNYTFLAQFGFWNALDSVDGSLRSRYRQEWGTHVPVVGQQVRENDEPVDELARIMTLTHATGKLRAREDALLYGNEWDFVHIHLSGPFNETYQEVHQFFNEFDLFDWMNRFCDQVTIDASGIVHPRFVRTLAMMWAVVRRLD